MTLPPEPYVWIVLIVLVALVAGLAIWKGGGFKVGGSKDGFTFEAQAPKGNDDQGKVVVARGAEFDRVKAGDIIGVKGGQATTGGVDVLSEAKIKDGEIGDIVGVQEQSPKNSEK